MRLVFWESGSFRGETAFRMSCLNRSSTCCSFRTSPTPPLEGGLQNKGAFRGTLTTKVCRILNLRIHKQGIPKSATHHPYNILWLKGQTLPLRFGQFKYACWTTSLSTLTLMGVAVLKDLKYTTTLSLDTAKKPKPRIPKKTKPKIPKKPKPKIPKKPKPKKPKKPKKPLFQNSSIGAYF